MADEATSLYREAILRHAHDTRHAGRVERPSHAGSAHNPLCGDELELSVALEGGVIREIKVQVRGCLISQAAASMMSEAVQGLPLAAAQALGERFRAAMERGEGELPEALAALRPLLEVRRHPSRIRCTLLPWEPLLAFPA